jgi:endonuclease-3 related protein
VLKNGIVASEQTTQEVLIYIYRQLLAGYGSQHWWPADGPFEVMVGAVLTQSCAWRNVEKAITALKKAGKLSAAALRCLDLQELAGIIRPCGYYNAKARKLKSLANWLERSCRDNLDGLDDIDTPSLREQLLSVHGIGPETADSILLYAVGRPVFVIDAYTHRIVSRLSLSPCSQSYAACQALFQKNLPADSQLFNEYHALLVRLGKDFCRKQPHCPQCCLMAICQFYQQWG